MDHVDLSGTRVSKATQLALLHLCVPKICRRVQAGDATLGLISWRGVCDDGALRTLAQALHGNNTMRTLDLRLSTSLSDAGSAALDAVLPECVVDKVPLEDTGAGQEGRFRVYTPRAS